MSNGSPSEKMAVRSPPLQVRDSTGKCDAGACSPTHVDSDVSLIEFDGAYFQVIWCGIAA